MNNVLMDANTGQFWSILGRAENIAFITILIIIAGSAGLLIGFTIKAEQAKCPKCKKWSALKLTGRREDQGGGIIFKNWHHEYECQFCNHKIWRKPPSSFIGGGGG